MNVPYATINNYEMEHTPSIEDKSEAPQTEFFNLAHYHTQLSVHLTPTTVFSSFLPHPSF